MSDSDNQPVAQATAPTSDLSSMMPLGTFMQSSYAYDGTKGFDLYETAKRVVSDTEFALYNTYDETYRNSDLAQFLVNSISSALMDFRLESEDKTKLKLVEDFFYTNAIEDQLMQMLHNAFVFGTGIMQKWETAGSLVNITRVDASTVEIEKDRVTPRGELIFEYIQDTGGDDPESTRKLNAKRLITFKPFELPDQAHGLSLMRSSLLPLQAISQLNMDIPAGIKRLAYETMVLYLDLEGVEPSKQKDAIKRAVKSFVKYDSATNTVIALDGRHKLNYVGSDGGSSQKIIPILTLIEPILIFLLNKWHVPLSEVLQGNSNRALATTQSLNSKKRLNALKKKFAHFIERNIIAAITGELETEEAPSVRVTHNTDFVEVKDELDYMLRCFQLGVVSREAIVSKLGLKETDEEQTFFVPNTGSLVMAKPGELPQVIDERAEQVRQQMLEDTEAEDEGDENEEEDGDQEEVQQE